MRKWVSVVSLFLATAAFAPVEDSSATAVRILFTGDVQGTFEPCGCAGGPDGGLSRRVGYTNGITETWKGPLLQIDAGNYFESPGPSAEAINRLLEASLERIPIAAMNLGSDDLYWWPQLSQIKVARERLISTNLEPREAGMPSPQRYLIRKMPLAGVEGGAVRIAFLGLANPMLVKPNSGFRGLDPVEAVRNVMPELRKNADMVIVLWDTIRPAQQIPPDSPIVRLAQSVEGIDLIITTEKRFVRYRPLQVGSTTILSSIERGRYLGDLLVTFDRSRSVKELKPDFVELKEGVREDPQIRAEQDRVAASIR